MRRRALHLVAIVVLAGAAVAVPLPSMRPPAPPAYVPAPAPSPPGWPSPLREHADDVADYTLTARLDTARHTVHGEGTVRFRNTSSAPVRELWLHLYLNAFKTPRSLFAREPVGGYRGAAPVTDRGEIELRALSWKRGEEAGGSVDLLSSVELSRRDEEDETGEDETDARVALPREVQPGETVTLGVAWDDKLPALVFRTGYAGSFHFVGQWFPKLARLEPDGTWAHFRFHRLAEFYADFGTYDVTLDVPEGFVIGATGPVVEARTGEGRHVERHVQADVHDFAWTAWDAFRSRDEVVGDVRVRVLYPAGREADVLREIAAVRFALPYFGDRYGAYPYGELTIVHPPDAAAEAGGMEYPTLITTGEASYGGLWSHLIELVTVHELAHQYFYGLVASNEAVWPFLDEGVASFAEADVLRAMFGAGSVIDAPGFAVADDTIAAVFGDAAEHRARVAQPARAFSTGDLYSTLVYERTASVLETLRRVYGDEAMRRSLGGYARRFRFLHPGPEAFLQAFDEGMGDVAAATLRTALFDEGWVDFAVGELSCQATPDGPDGWVLVERRGTLTLPVSVELVMRDGSRQRATWDGEGDQTIIPYHGRGRLRGVVVDPDHAVLIDDDLTNNHATCPGQDAEGAPRVLERATYWAELLVQAVSP